MKIRLPQKHFHLAFSFVMGAMMATVITLVLTLVNAGLAAGFMARWARTLGVAYVVVVPGIYFLAPIARRIVNRIVDPPLF